MSSTGTLDAAAALRDGVDLLVRRLRQLPVAGGELTLPQRSALARLDRGGPMTAADLAKLEQISPQSMGSTIAELEAQGLVERAADPGDGRRLVVTVSKRGQSVIRQRRSARVARMAEAMSAEFSAKELAQLAAATPLLERLAQRL
jgi:DNA-binding MarR family transcriptional regulator